MSRPCTIHDIKDFISKRCLVGPRLQVGSEMLYNTYVTYAGDMGIFPLTQCTFLREVRVLGYNKDPNHEIRRGFIGITLAPPPKKFTLIVLPDPEIVAPALPPIETPNIPIPEVKVKAKAKPKAKAKAKAKPEAKKKSKESDSDSEPEWGPEFESDLPYAIATLPPKRAVKTASPSRIPAAAQVQPRSPSAPIHYLPGMVYISQADDFNVDPKTIKMYGHEYDRYKTLHQSLTLDILLKETYKSVEQQGNTINKKMSGVIIDTTGDKSIAGYIKYVLSQPIPKIDQLHNVQECQAVIDWCLDTMELCGNPRIRGADPDYMARFARRYSLATNLGLKLDAHLVSLMTPSR